MSAVIHPQANPADTVSTPAAPAALALSTLCLIARLHQVAANPVHLAHQLGWSPEHQPEVDDLLLAARHLGLQAKLTRTSLQRIALSPGMNVTAEIKTGRRRVIDYLFSPVQKALNESLGER